MSRRPRRNFGGGFWCWSASVAGPPLINTSEILSQLATENSRVYTVPYQGTPRTVAEMIRVANGDRGQKSWILRKQVENIIRFVRPRDYWSEVLAIYYWVCGPRFRYTRDPRRVEQIKDPLRMLWEIAKYGVTLGDCDDLATFIMASIGSIGGRSRIVTVGFHSAGGRKPREDIFKGLDMQLITSPHPRLPGPFTHVFCQGVKSPGGWVTLDPVAGPRTTKMHRRVRQVRIYEPND
jgi:hypothetical protein